MRWLGAGLLVAFALAPGASAQTPVDPTGFAAAADIAAQVAAMTQAMTPEQGFAWKPLLRSGATVAAIEIWRKPARPAVHPDQAEYATVIAGAGTLVSGGTLEQPVTVKPDLVEGARIIGGTTRPLAPGDVILIPAGVPHWFGITGDRLVLLGTKVASEP
ncbi:cupin domain-containing protein [Glacieibacterium megasporae]|uniref:cupin domain-containing protein n=1 Tax=Glacieibacterium megasporae TaxID=2835787 RepID=UPI001C1E754C|nr:cupin domain-containing protein [Polymorphobacter megasporae]UAJ12204.1 cupin domain-containing protein [Polymorphobacter megasporae]